jgi:hypothetical protein
MDDLSEKLSGILSDPEAMKEIAQLASSLGVEAPGVHKAPQPEPKNVPSGDALSMMSGLMPLMGTLRQEDDTTRLLDAIRPFLSEERREKLDKAKKMLKMMKLLPLLREFNLFDL